MIPQKAVGFSGWLAQFMIAKFHRPDIRCLGFQASASGTPRQFGCDAEFRRYRGKADVDQAESNKLDLRVRTPANPK
jgi:hypothetical protein